MYQLSKEIKDYSGKNITCTFQIEVNGLKREKPEKPILGRRYIL